MSKNARAGPKVRSVRLQPDARRHGGTMRSRILAVMIGTALSAVCGSMLVMEARAARQPTPQGRGATGTVILENAPSDHSVPIPLDTLRGYYKDMDAR